MSSETGKKLDELLNIVSRLRSPGGCPWDIKQTADSFKSYLLEETHELIEAIDQNQSLSIKEELGDLFFQLVFIGRIFEEKNEFSTAEAIQAVCEKMIRRHPHVFGDTKVDSIEAQKQLWLSIKNTEKDTGQTRPDNFLNAVPRSLPALRRSQRIIERASHSGFKWPDHEMILAKMHEEIEELQEAINTGDHDKISDELGDLIFSTVNLGNFIGVHAEDALKQSTEKFISRFNFMQETLEKEALPMKDASFEQMLMAWEKAKKR